MPKLTGTYETVAIFSLKNGDEAVQANVEKFTKLIADNAEITKTEEWGKRRLAYPIEDETEGFYILIEFTGSPAFPTELDRVYKITEGVLRSLIIAL